MSDLKKMNKKALEEYGRTVGIELDRRKTKKDLVKDVEEQLAKSSELINTFTDVLEMEKEKQESSNQVLLRDKNTGRFSKGDQPPGNPTATYGGKPYWEV
jgi:hypothetical protein|tara:strand:- start:13446 stop:13745 length:300 start_codon:yes stop_codon:yes gene_type:complete